MLHGTDGVPAVVEVLGLRHGGAKAEAEEIRAFVKKLIGREFAAE